MSGLFYSQVNSAVQAELIARGQTRTGDNSNKAFDFMLGKIANVTLQAFDSPPTQDSTPLPNFGILGGTTVLNGSYRPTGEKGYLNDQVRPAYRIPPVLTSVSVNVNDQSKLAINKATITIKILDVTTDLEEMEEIYCRPGRHIRLRIAHPDSAILSDKTLADATNVKLPTTAALEKLFPGVDLLNLKKMNEYYFSGRISTFNYSYNEDASIDLTFEAIGTTNTYLDINATIAQATGKTDTGEKSINQVENVYTTLIAEIEEIQDQFKKENKTEFEYLKPETTDQSILVGIPYVYNGANAPSTERMISLGYFINFINRKFMDKIDAKLICTDEICQSNTFYPKLVSADPTQILLWSGTGNSKTDSYYFDADEDQSTNKSIAEKNGITPIDPAVKMFPNITPTTGGFLAQDGKAYPARIYINVELINTIIEVITKSEEKDLTIKNLLMKIGNSIQKNTGNAIKMVVVQDPIHDNALLYVDSNYIDLSTTVNEFTIPAWPSLTGRTIVRNFQLTTNVPNSVKNMIFGINAIGSGTQKQVAYSGYIYSDAETKLKLEQDWKADYATNNLVLAKEKNNIAVKPKDATAIDTLQKALESYVIYFTDDIKKSLNFTKAYFPMNLSFTIDGINGLKYGDVLQFDGIPRRYRDSYVFMIVGITHSVSTSGEWTTEVTCNPRVRLKS